VVEQNFDNVQKWGVLVAVGIGTFMTALDTSVVNTVLPVIEDSLKEPITSIQWVVTIYLLVLSGLLLSFGRLGDMHGHKRIFITGFLIFMGGSFFSGSAPNVAILVASRALQALGAAMLASNSPAILTKSFPSEQRGQALGLQATMTYLGLTAGPVLGGWLASLFGWRVVFYINLPVGVAAILMSMRYIPHDRDQGRKEQFDYFGALTFLFGLGALLLGLNQGGEWGWTSWPILLLLAGAVIILSLFVFIETRVSNPMLDLGLFKELSFSLTTLSAIINYIGVFTSIFLMPFYLEQGRGFSPAQAGLILAAQPIIMAIIAPISGTLSDRIGTRLPAMFGMAVLSAGLFLLSRLTGLSTIPSIMLALLVVGLGTGAFISPNNSALMGSAPRSRQGIASGILATARNFGMVLGIGISGAIFTTILARSSGGAISPNLGASNPAIFLALQASFFVASMITILGVITSAVRVVNRS
jgi:EmrB/QacA subfamily drug resistance transporter